MVRTTILFDLTDCIDYEKDDWLFQVNKLNQVKIMVQTIAQ